MSKKYIAAVCLGVLALGGCHPDQSDSVETIATSSLPPAPPPPTGLNRVVATVRGQKITLGDMQPILMDGYGLNVLMILVQRDLVQQEAARQNITVTPADIEAERNITLEQLQRATVEMSPGGAPTSQPDLDLSEEQKNQLLDTLLQQQHISLPEFNAILEVNAYLRKIAGPRVAAQITDDRVRARFNEMYGEKVRVHYIVSSSMSDAADVRRDLAAGKSFDEVARARSIDRRTAYNGGELPPFSMHDNRFPPEFAEVAFSLKPGEISDPVQIKSFIYIIKLIDRIPPSTAKYEDYRDSVRKELYDTSVQAAMTVMRQQMGRMALSSLHISDPALETQFQAKLAEANGQVHDMNEIRRDLDARHSPATMPATSMPATMPDEQLTVPPMDAPATQSASPGAPPALEAAPATMPAAAPIAH